MRNAEFRAWMRGYFELAEPVPLELAQVQVIVNHLNLAEAVEGNLDAENLEIRASIRSFRDGGKADVAALSTLTAAIQRTLHLP
jgi:hypothetical protein